MKCLQLVLTQDDHLWLAFAADSKYFIDGATGGAARWKEANWVINACRLANHVDLLIEVLPLLETQGHRATMLHIKLQGNDLADGLANDGRSRNPLYKYLPPGSQPSKK